MKKLILLAIAILTFSSTALADTNGFVKIQFNYPETEKNIQIYGGFQHNFENVPRLGIAGFATIKNGWAEGYVGPTIWAIPKHLRFGINIGLSQASNGPLARMSFCTLAKYGDFGFYGNIEWNIVKLNQMEQKTWYVLKAWYRPINWFQFGLYSKRSTGFGPFAEFIFPLWKNATGSIFVNWAVLPAENKTPQYKNFLFTFRASM